MKQKISHHISKMTTFALFLLCIITPLRAQTDSLANLPQYLFTHFDTSAVRLKTGEFSKAYMNYNTLTEKMAFYKKGVLLNLIKPETVDTIWIQNRLFVPFENAFYEVIVIAPISLFIQHRSDLTAVGKPAAYGASSQTTSSTTITKLYSDKAYNLKLPQDLKVTHSTVYWVRMNNVMYRFMTERQLLKIFASKEDELKKFIKKSNLDIIKNQDDLIKLIIYCNKIKR